jgi:hypothetical protein
MCATQGLDGGDCGMQGAYDVGSNGLIRVIDEVISGRSQTGTPKGTRRAAGSRRPGISRRTQDVANVAATSRSRAARNDACLRAPDHTPAVISVSRDCVKPSELVFGL